MRFSHIVPLALLLAGCGQAPPTPRSRTEVPKKTAAPVKILQFYAGSLQVGRGEPVKLCYGVENAASVHIEPPVEQLKPGYNRCIDVMPERTTTYRLVVEGVDGGTLSQSVTVEVVAASRAPTVVAESPKLFTLIFSSATEVAPGQPATLCYGAPQAASVTVEPAVQELKPSKRFCFTVTPSQTTTYVLTAASKDGRKETERLTIKVR
ncbi:MAG: hypothetical protein M1541_01945 [Acidobacteria bacterium]|nr:hypothetical protein [Acidobacteriota bacterium]